MQEIVVILNITVVVDKAQCDRCDWFNQEFDMAMEVAAHCSDVDDSSSDTSECSMEIDDSLDNPMEIDDDGV